MPFDEEKQIQQLVSLYRQGFEEILRAIVQKEAKGQWTQYWRDLLLEVRVILQQLDQYADQWIERTIGQVYSQAAAQTVAFLSQLGMQRPGRAEFAQVHQRAVDVVAQNMADNLRGATQFIGRRVNDVFRQVGLEQTGGKLAAGQTWQDMKRKVVQQLLDKGQTAFVDRLGRKWRLDTYAEMVARTTTREAASVATLNTCQEFGLDLVQITTHYPTCEKCAPLQGKVYSISGNDERYPRLTDERRPPIHPNCRHSCHPYVRELDDNAEETERRSNEPLDKDPRSEAEKQAYTEMRDAVTIATNRRRAREVLYSEAAPLGEKVKAARKLQRSYETSGTMLTGKDASLLKQFREYITGDSIEGLITAENSVIPDEKLVDYALNKNHPGDGKAKAIAFERALGYNQSNYRDLIENIKQNLARFPARFKGSNEFGDRYEVILRLEGPNGKEANVLTSWIILKNEDIARLTSLYVTRRKAR